MIESLGLSWFDVIAIVVVLLSALMAFARGLIREVFSIVAFVVAAIAAIYLADVSAQYVTPITGLEGTLATLAAGLFIFLVVFIVITVLTSVLAKSVHESAEIGALDRVGGAVYGVLRGALVVALFVLLMTQSTRQTMPSPEQRMPRWIAEAKTYPAFEWIANGLRQLPGLEELRKQAQDAYNNRPRAESRPAASPAATAPIPPTPDAAKAPEPAAEKGKN